jgi:hypothetical protein
LSQETFTRTLLPEEQPDIKHGIKTTGRDLLMKRKASALILVLLISSFLTPLVAEAQPTPPDGDTLGPAEFNSQYETGSVIILSPENSTIHGNPIQLNFTVSVKGFFGQFGNVGFSVDGGVIKSVTNFVNKSVVSTEYQFWDLTTVVASVTLFLSEGTHNATAYLGWQYQGIGRRYQVYAYATVQFTIDTTPPTISVLSIQNATYGTTDVDLNFSVSEPVSQISYSLDGQENMTVAGNTTLADLSMGEHNVTVYAWDTAGNMGASETVTFTVAVPAPFPTVPVAAASVAVVAAVIAGLLVYFKKRKH